MRLFRSIAGAQGGRVFANLGAAFDMNDEMAAQVVRYFLPPITKAIVRRMETMHGLVHFLDMVGAQRHDRYLAEPAIFGHPKIEAEGQAVIEALFPNPAQLQKIIANRAQVLPVEPSRMLQMLPYIAILALGAIELKTRQPLKAITIRLLNGRADPVAAGNPYKSLAAEIRRRHASENASDPDRRAGIASVISALFAWSEAKRAA